MKIDTAAVAFQSRHENSATRTLRQEERFWLSPPQSNPEASSASAQMYGVAAEETGLSPKELHTKRLLEKLFEAMTGKRVRLHPTESFKASAPENLELHAAAAERPGAGFGYIFRREEHYSEQESLAFDASVTFVNETGERREATLSLRLARSFVRDETLEIRLGEALKDPLVVSTSGDLALAPERFAFDIDADGTNEHLFRPTASTGFLAYDRNGNGTVDHGGELFGPLSGNGFADLKKLDDDGNDILDGNDLSFDNLRIWMDAATPQERLIGLAEAGIGALFLSAIDADFSFKDGDNATLGKLRRLGIALGEDGSAHPLAQIDAVV